MQVYKSTLQSGKPMMDSRATTPTQTSELVGMVMMLYSIPQTAKTDAVVVCPGLGEDWRIIEAIQAWNSSSSKYLLISGRNRAEKPGIILTPENLSKPPYNLARSKGVIIQPTAQHTKEQTDWIVEKVCELGITSLSLFVSPYHLLRAYGTLLASCTRRDIRIPMIPVPIIISPETLVPDTGLNGWQSVAGEVERITKYQPTGDVADFNQLQNYLDWLWKHPIITT